MTKAITTKMRPTTKRYRNNHTSRYAHRPPISMVNVGIVNLIPNIFYYTIKSFFPKLDTKQIKEVFIIFISMTNFTDVLKNVPDFPDLPMTKDDMNVNLCKFTLKLKEMSKPQQSPRNKNVIRGGGSVRAQLRHKIYNNTEPFILFIQFCFSIFILLDIPPEVAPFFAALVLFTMINLIQHYIVDFPGFDDMYSIVNDPNFQSRAQQNLIYSQALVLPIQFAYICRGVFNWLNRLWLNRLLGSGDTALTIDTLKPSHILANHPYPTSFKSRSQSPKLIRSNEASPLI